MSIAIPITLREAIVNQSPPLKESAFKVVISYYLYFVEMTRKVSELPSLAVFWTEEDVETIMAKPEWTIALPIFTREAKKAGWNVEVRNTTCNIIVSIDNAGTGPIGEREECSDKFTISPAVVRT